MDSSLVTAQMPVLIVDYIQSIDRLSRTGLSSSEPTHLDETGDSLH